jgi:hypothetical protein
MAISQSPADTLRKAKEKGSGRDTAIVNGKPNFKKLQPGKERNYQNKLNLWHEYVTWDPLLAILLTMLDRYARQNPDASPYDIVSLQSFVREMAYAIDGAEGIEKACEETVRKYWNNFTAAWRRANPESPEIPRDMARSVTHVHSFIFVI